MKRILLRLLIVTTCFFCCRLIGEFLLPPSNVLPRSYRELCAFMKYIGMEYQTIDVCLEDHVIYHKENEYAIECLECIQADIKMIK